MSNGVALSTAPADQLYPRVVSDDAGGVIVAWQDQRGGGWDIYAQQLGADGTFAGPEPRIVSVRDVPADQGGWVRIKWQASYLDTLPTSGIALYGIWRRVEESAALQVKSAGARAGDAGSHRVRVTRAGMSTTYWEGVGTVAARGNATYTFTAPTFADSTADGNPYSVFMVDAHASTSPQFWSSSPDSGYSVDNLPPLLPTPFSARPMVSGITLQWEANREHDLAGYRIYRGATADFAPGPSTFLTSTFAVGHVDAGGAVGDWYKLAAVDVHGNASPFAIASTDEVHERVGQLGVIRACPRHSAPDVARTGVPRRVLVAAAAVLRRGVGIARRSRVGQERGGDVRGSDCDGRRVLHLSHPGHHLPASRSSRHL